MTETTLDREDFRAAAARCRRAVWRVGAAASVCSAFVLLVLAVLFTPITLVVLTLAFDLVNFVWPVPAMPTWAMAMAGLPRQASNGAWLATVLTPPLLVTLALFAWAYRQIGRALASAPPFAAVDDIADIGIPGARPVDPSSLAEVRLRNTLEEMAIAAGLPAPQLRLIDAGANAAIVGIDERRTVVVAGVGLSTLSRDAMQGVAAHLLASAANGDLRVGLAIARFVVLVALFKASGGLFERGGPTRAARLAVALLWPTRARCRQLVTLLAESAPMPTPGAPTRLRAVDWLMMPLAGPLGLASIPGMLLLDLVALPLIALTWRQRKFMADATAVRLTRYPDALAEALTSCSVAGDTRMLPWVSHLCVVEMLPPPDPAALSGVDRVQGAVQHAEQRARELLGSSAVALYPHLSDRRAALTRMGAQTAQPSTPAPAPARTDAHDVAPWVWLIAGPLLALAVVLLPVAVAASVAASIAVSGVFTVLPGFLLHLLLRAAA